MPRWIPRDAAARLAVRSHLPATERVHFSQYKSAKTLYDAVAARYSSPATAALSRLMLLYLFPDLAAFATVTDLITQLRTSDTRYRAALPAEFCAQNPPPMYITLYYLVTRLPDTLRSVRDHFLSLCPTTLTVDLLEELLLAAEASITAVATSRGDPRTPFFEGCSPVPLLPSVASAAAVDLVGTDASGGAEPGGAESGGAEPERAESGGAEPGVAEPWGAGSRVAEPERAEPGGAASGGAEPGAAGSGGVEPAGAGPGGPSGALSRRELPCPQELREWFARRWSLAAGAGGATGAGGSAAVGGPGAGGAAGTGAGGSASAGGAAAAAAVGGSAVTGGTGAGGATEAGPGGSPSAGPAGAPGAGAGGAAGVGAARGNGAGAGVSAGGPAGAGAARGTGAGGAAGVGANAEGTGVVPAGPVGAERPRPYFVPLLEQVLGLLPSPSPAPSLACPPHVQFESQLQLASPLPAPSPYAGPTGGLPERREPESRLALHVRTARTSRRVPRLRPPAVPSTHPMALRPSTAPQPSPPESSLTALADPVSDSLRAASPTVMRLLTTVVTDHSFESTAASAIVTELVDFAAHCRLDYAASLVAESAYVYPPSVKGECALSTDVLEDRQEEFQCFATALPHLVSTLLAPEGDPDAPDIPTPRSYAEAIEGPYSSQWQAAMDAEMASWKSTGTYVDAVPPPGANIWHDTLRTTLAALGFAPSTADPSLTLRAAVLHPRSHMVQQVLQRFDFTYSSPQATPLSTRHSLSALLSYESVEPSGPYPELVGSLISSCEAEIYAGAMSAQELRWLTYLLTNQGEPPRSPPVLYVDNKAMLALCREHRLEHRTKHIALRYFLARELQQRGQLRLAYVASWANTADIFTTALQPCDHQRFCTMLDLVPTWPHLLTS
ncbi:unnamed protein product [Closterium sp. NIES-54]